MLLNELLLLLLLLLLIMLLQLLSVSFQQLGEEKEVNDELDDAFVVVTVSTSASDIGFKIFLL